MSVGVLLSGCGIGDGSQIGEVMLTYLALDKYGLEYVPMAPDKNQKQVMNHLAWAEEESKPLIKFGLKICRH